MPNSLKKLEDLLALYKECAEGTGNSDPQKANQKARKLHEYYRQLRASEEGRAGVISLLTDSSPHVRCWAAAHALAWDPNKAREVLEALRDGKGKCSFDAEILLEQFEKGQLSFD